MLGCKQDIDLYSSRGSTAVYSGLPLLLPQVDNRQPAQPVHVLLKACTGDFLRTLGDPELVGTSSGTGMCVVCTFDLLVCKVLCFQ